MNPLITTNQIESSHFGITRMEDIFLKNNGLAEAPHRHDHYVIILVAKAKGKHIVDFQEYEFENQQVYFLNPGQVHQVAESEIPKGFSIFVSTDFLINHNININLIEDVNLFHTFGHSPPLKLNEHQMQTLSFYAEEMFKAVNFNQKYQSEIIASYLKLFLIQCNNHCSLEQVNPQKVEAGNTILRRFKQLVEEHFHEWSSPSDYASVLNITPDHLNRSIKNLIGLSAKSYIQNRQIIAAKRLLFFSNLSTKEIGFSLGFSEPAHFSAFFRKNAGISPSDFRRGKMINSTS